MHSLNNIISFLLYLHILDRLLVRFYSAMGNFIETLSTKRIFKAAEMYKYVLPSVQEVVTHFI